VFDVHDEIRFLLDVNVGRAVKEYLGGEGFDVKWVLQVNPRMDDADILSLAVEESRVLVTVDKDFGDLVFNQGLAHRGVIRLEDTSPRVQVQYLRALIRQHRWEIIDHMVVLEAGRIRIRPR
jgi:predicted nuclease of predicted toxin-antitoxin system